MLDMGRRKQSQPVSEPRRRLATRLEALRGYDTLQDDSLDILAGIVQEIRPFPYINIRHAQGQLAYLTGILEGDEVLLATFRELVLKVFAGSNVTEVLNESGINSEHNFFRELRKRLKHKILPPLRSPGSFSHAIDTLFCRKTDYRWVEGVDERVWIGLFDTLNLDRHIDGEKTVVRLCKSLCITSSRISALGVEPDIQRCIDDEEQLLFIKQNRTTLELAMLLGEGGSAEGNPAAVAERLSEELSQCELVIGRIRDGISEYGTSLHQTYVMLRLGQLIDRIRMILDIVSRDKIADPGRVVHHFRAIVKNENTKTSLRSLVHDNIEFLAYRIAEHERNTGEHYITVTRKEYWQMLRSAMGGGVIISFVAIIKSLFHFIRLAPFWQGFAYSVNYAAGFIGIYASGSTLATKQPAMTASAIASSLDGPNRNHPNLAELAILVSEVVRSQTASFVGNLAIVFPLTLCIAWLWNIVFGFPIVDGAAAQAMLDNQNPLKSLSLLYACFTGIFLYLSGIISGFFDNLAIYGNIPERLRQHPWLRSRLTGSKVEKIADYTGHHLGGIMGNLCLGFFLGMAGFVGDTFGISFDIRHITISTGNFAIGLQGLGFNVSTSDLIWTTVGVLMIGFLNFLVSFSLAFFTALFSRKVRFRHYRRFMLYLSRLLVRYPLDFIRPPKTQRKPSDFLRHRARPKVS